ncbi:protein of unknown function [Candidatus Filomicrobium marinum]|uniref:Uncharacterized protein n=2 Tax=Filomicrobium TaxID=119044 RepID=A0A0D6JKS6_9HYPH|nr:protein of unknown function [Candidatus Filomicrobium marinum]CPR22569.1 protein of unknown function [Candidatus Filomicrobium marinum]SDO79709.1 hypothetical protein SAMN04488061_1684 [Filomicrobium insigne]
MAQRAKRNTSVCCAIAYPTTQIEMLIAITTAMERKKPNQDSVWVVVIARSSGLAHFVFANCSQRACSS